MTFRKTDRRLAAAVLAALVAATSGCGAIFNGTRQSINVMSAPDQASVTTSPNTGTFTTPTNLDLERKHNYVLTFNKDGYKPATFTVNRHMQGGILALDILFTGLLGVVVDAATGAWYKLSPEAATVSLTQVSASDPGPDTIEVYVTPTDHGIGVRSSTPGVGVTVHEARH